MNTMLLLAQQPAQGAQSAVFMPVMMFLMIGLVFFVSIRQQRKRDKERRQLLESLKSGDRVVFSGGILGTVVNVKERTAVVKIADNTKVEILRSSVGHIIPDGGDLPAGDQPAN